MNEAMGAPFEPRELLDSLGKAVIATDLDGTVEFWNRAAEQLYGWTAEDALGQKIADLCVPEPSRQVADDIMEAIRTGGSWSGGFLVRRKDGTVFPALVTDSGIYRDGKLVGIVGISINVGRTVRPLVERSTDAALMLRSDATVTYASAAVRQLFGWDDEALLGTSIVPLIHSEDRETLASFLARVVQVPGPHPPVELRVRVDDEWAWAEAALTNLLDDPDVRGVVCNLRRSVRREAYEAARDRAQQLQTALDSRVLIEQAKGFLAAQESIDPDVAFELIRDHARRNRVRTHDICREVLTGRLVLKPDPGRKSTGRGAGSRPR
jgi:PAS domain S-box-containing protein